MSPRLRYLSTTLALVAVGFGYAMIQGRLARPAPRIEARVPAARPVLPPASPTAREILDRGATLSLTGDQKTRLSALGRRWREESAELNAALQAAEQEFSRFMAEAQTGGKTSLQEIQRRSADLQSLGAALRERRQIHGEAALGILTAQQREKLSGGTSPEQSGGIR